MSLLVWFPCTVEVHTNEAVKTCFSIVHLMSHTLMNESIAHDARRLGSVNDQPTSLYANDKRERERGIAVSSYCCMCDNTIPDRSGVSLETVD